MIQGLQCREIVQPAAYLVFGHPQPLQNACAEIATRRSQGVVNPRPVATAGHKARVFQGSQMAGDLGLTQAQHVHNLADTDFTLPEEIEDAEPGIVGQGFEDGCGLGHRYNPLFAEVRVSNRVMQLASATFARVQASA